jgi:hypothetical protein|tara:strand:+ start:17217 stop:17396 length:180 start_codon:yes stop_codon:yes gene_type:complete
MYQTDSSLLRTVHENRNAIGYPDGKHGIRRIGEKAVTPSGFAVRRLNLNYRTGVNLSTK